MSPLITLIIAATFMLDTVVFFIGARALGVFERVRSRNEFIESVTLVYDFHTGAYAQTPQVAAHLCKRLQAEEQVNPSRLIAVHFNPPGSALTMKSIAGCILGEKEEARADQLVERGYKVATLPRMNADVVPFPYKASISSLVVTKRVYPVLFPGGSLNATPEAVLELYDPGARSVIIAAHLEPPLAFEQFL